MRCRASGSSSRRGSVASKRIAAAADCSKGGADVSAPRGGWPSGKPIVIAHRHTHVPGTAHAGGKDDQITLTDANRRAACRGDDHVAFKIITSLFTVVGPGKNRLGFGPDRPAQHPERGM